MVDMIAYADRIPDPGETLHGRGFALGFGGKGANQAVMAALLGAQVSMVGCVGDDMFGPMTIDNFKGFGIDVTQFRKLPGITSGVAPIWVEPSGVNRIIVVSGANAGITEDQVSAALDTPSAPDVVLCQLEIPQPIVRLAFELGRRRGSITILNPAPADLVDPAILELCDWLIPNEHEFAAIARVLGIDSPGDVESRIGRISRLIDTSVVVTQGAEGATLCLRENGTVEHVPAPRVQATDTTGAGDAFVGAFAFALATGAFPTEAVHLGCACAAASVTRRGTQSSFPRGDEIVALRAESSKDGLRPVASSAVQEGDTP